MPAIWTVTVDDEKCVGCGQCAEVCPVAVYAMRNGKADPVREDDCLECLNCIKVCAMEAVSVRPRA